MLTLQELQQKLDGLEEQLKKSALDYSTAREALTQQMANHNALEGAVMLARQMVSEEKVKEGYVDDQEPSLELEQEPVPAE